MKLKTVKKEHYSFVNLKRVLYATIWLVFIMTSCKKEFTDVKQSISVKGSTDWILPYSFNWEDTNLNWMPYPASEAQIPLPWNGQGSLYSTLDPDVLNDRKASDGWILLYSTFSTTTLSYNPYFILYNKYRGLMRVFMYVNNSSFGSSSYLKDGISQATNQYSVLNFAGSDIVDVSTNQTTITKIEQAPKDGSAPFSSFKWYMLQYELAYDPTIVATTSANPPQLSFNINSIDITQVSLGGTVVGKLNGTIGATGPSDIFSNITSLISPLGKGVIAAVGSSALSKYKTSDTSNSMGLNNDVFKAVSSGVASLVSTAAAGIPGAVFNILSAIVGGSSGSAGQTVSLNLNADISLAGTMTNTTGLPSTPASFYFPGSLLADVNGNYNVSGFVPLHNKPLGVFNVVGTPIITRNIQDDNAINEMYHLGLPIDDHPYSMDYAVSELNIVWNPEVLNNATIQNLKYDIIVSHSPSDVNNPQCGTEYLNNGSYWGNFYVIKYGNPSQLKKCGFYQEGVAPMVRLAFNVVPNNGDPTVTIIKTFKAQYNDVFGADWLY